MAYCDWNDFSRPSLGHTRRAMQPHYGDNPAAYSNGSLSARVDKSLPPDQASVAAAARSAIARRVVAAMRQTIIDA